MAYVRQNVALLGAEPQEHHSAEVMAPAVHGST